MTLSQKSATVLTQWEFKGREHGKREKKEEDTWSDRWACGTYSLPCIEGSVFYFISIAVRKFSNEKQLKGGRVYHNCTLQSVTSRKSQ